MNFVVDFIVNNCPELWTLIKVLLINNSEFVPRVGSNHILTASLFVGFWLISQSIIKAYSLIQCPTHTLPANIMFISMMLPILYSSIFRSTLTNQVLLMAWTITAVSLVISICISNSYNSIWTLLLYLPSSLVVLYQNEYQRHEICKLIISKDQEIIKVNTEATLNCKEQQNMVSNVTHDLKTVSDRNYFLIC